MNEGTGRTVMRWIMVAFYAAAGVIHLMAPEPFMKVTPDWVPYPHAVILITGVCELFGAAGLVTRRFRWWAGVMLAAYAVCVFPANIKHAWLEVAVQHNYESLWYHIPRMPLQPVLIWWALYVGGVIDWPWRRRSVMESP